MPTNKVPDQLHKFVLRVMQIERRYAHRLKGVRNARREAIREVMEEYGPTAPDIEDTDET